MLPAIIEGSRFRLRPWALSDKAALVRHANNRNVSRSLRDAFPFPYTGADADRWLGHAAGSAAPPWLYAIEMRHLRARQGIDASLYLGHLTAAARTGMLERSVRSARGDLP